MTDVTALLDQMERELVKPGSHDRPNGPLFHYTNAPGLAGIIRDRQIWATQFAFTNDAQELVAGEQIVNELAEELLGNTPPDTPAHWLLENFLMLHKSSGQSISQIADLYLASFSSEGNLLSQWRGYAADGMGYSIGVQKFRLPDSNPPDADKVLVLLECEYDKANFRIRVGTELSEVVTGFEKYVRTYCLDVTTFNDFLVKSVGIALRQVALLIPRFKNEHFREEKEWRLVATPMPGHEKHVVQYRASDRGLIPYIPVDLADHNELLVLSDIFVGPRQCPDASVKALADFLSSLGYSGHDLARPSGIPYRGI